KARAFGSRGRAGRSGPRDSRRWLLACCVRVSSLLACFRVAPSAFYTSIAPDVRLAFRATVACLDGDSRGLSRVKGRSSLRSPDRSFLPLTEESAFPDRLRAGCE